MLAGPAVADHWFAVGAVDSLDYRLVTRRVWLYGATTRRWALLLSFAPPGGFLDDSVRAGQRLHADLHFYPGSGQYRALVGERCGCGPAGRTRRPLRRTRSCSSGSPTCWPPTRGPPGCRPWCRPRLVPPDRPGGRWRLREDSGAYRELVELAGEPWPVFARSLGEPTPVFGEWGPAGFRPLSLLPDAAQLVVQRGGHRAGGVSRWPRTWEDLVTVALLGTDRRPLPDSAAAELGRARGRPTRDPTQVVLGLGRPAPGRRPRRVGTADRSVGDRSRRRTTGEPGPPEAAAGAAPTRWSAGRPDRSTTPWPCWSTRTSVSPRTHWTALATLAAGNPRVDRALLASGLGVRGVWFVGQNPQWARLAAALRSRQAGATS